MCVVIAAFSAIERELIKMGLTANESKMKYMLSTSMDRLWPIAMLTLLSVNFFILTLSLPAITMSVVSHGLNRQLSSRDMSRGTKLIFYKSLILPVFFSSVEPWTHYVSMQHP